MQLKSVHPARMQSPKGEGLTGRRSGRRTGARARLPPRFATFAASTSGRPFHAARTRGTRAFRVASTSPPSVNGNEQTMRTGSAPLRLAPLVSREERRLLEKGWSALPARSVGRIGKRVDHDERKGRTTARTAGDRRGRIPPNLSLASPPSPRPDERGTRGS